MTDLGWLVQRGADVPAGTSWLSPGERERVAAMSVAKRRDEFVLGRWTAKRALAIVSGTPVSAAVDVAADEAGAPYAVLDGRRLPVTVAITHRAGLAAALVDLAARPVGCDLEYVEPRTAAFVADYLTEQEQAYVGDDIRRRANLVWSAKESVLKLLGVGLRRSAREIDIVAGDVTVGAWTAYMGELSETGTRFPGWWRQLGTTHVFTVAYDSQRPPPEDLNSLSR